QGRSHRAINARAHAGRPGRKHQPRGRPQFLHRIDHDVNPQLSRVALPAHPKMGPQRSTQTIEDGTVEKSFAPVAFRGISPQYTPDHLLVCAILRPRATAKMVVPEGSSTNWQLRMVPTNCHSGLDRVLDAMAFTRANGPEQRGSRK